MNSSIGLATSSSLDPGTWTDLGEVFETKKGEQYNAIDPTSTVDENGKPVLTWGSYWENIFQFNLTGNSETVMGSPKQVAFNSTIKGNNPRPVEGSFLWPHGDFYYLFFSSGQCCSFNASALPPPGTEYKVFVGRSRSAHGPFVDANGVDLRSAGGTLVVASHGNVYAPGGEGVFSDKANGSERDVFVYHYLPASGPGAYTEPNASVGLNGIDWSSGWPVLTDL
ncbi:glycoside hydrolase family 43 protein [Gelatoporia subvermispora B]|uniref:Endo-1,5-alpha-L-arabinanase A n=1 Tax=Ceriporiopsis subvermispora (strain B) TaxID=914234 RepID=M2QRG4_CERS8|nr:glycoside hydrolase family 43 protein [Gelatoporia subvermispora B]